MPPKPTMQTVATKAGVSLMTVSRALKNHPSIPVSTRDRIKKIATELNYRPNPLVATLMAQLRSTKITPGAAPIIALLTCHPDPTEFTRPDTYLGQIFSGASSRARELGYKVEPFWLMERGMTADRMRQILRTRGIQGVILAPLPDPLPEINFDWSGFSSATVGYSYKACALNRAVNDQFTTIRIAVRKLFELGYNRIALAIRYEDDERVQNRWSGGLLSFQSYLSPAQRLSIFLWHEWHAAPFHKWLIKNKPEVIITLHPIVRTWIESTGMRIPQDIGLLYLNLEGEQIGCSGMHQHHERVSASALELVVEAHSTNSSGIPERPKVVMIEGEWAEGSTTRPQTVRLKKN